MGSTVSTACEKECKEFKQPSDIAAGVGWAMCCICSCCCIIMLLAFIGLAYSTAG